MRRIECVLAAGLLLGALTGCATTSPAGSGGSSGRVVESGKSSRPETPGQQAAALQVKLGQGYLNQGELETARDKLRRALELDPDSADAHTLMAVLNERIGRPEVAEQYYRRAVTLKPEDGGVNNNYGTFLCGTGRYPEAQQHFERAVKDPFYRTPAVAYANGGFCALKSGDPVVAERMLRAALELEPQNPGALYELARLNFNRGEFMRARAFLQRYEAVSAAEPEALQLGASIEQGIGDRAAAARYLKQLQERFPEYVPATAPDQAGSR
jgi:type IV pilus assembly protein PilF